MSVNKSSGSTFSNSFLGGNTMISIGIDISKETIILLKILYVMVQMDKMLMGEYFLNIVGN